MIRFSRLFYVSLAPVLLSMLMLGCSKTETPENNGAVSTSPDSATTAEENAGTNSTNTEVEATATAATDQEYAIKLGLMKGHLLVAKELLAQQKPDQAEPHIGHPVEEIYQDVQAELEKRNVPEFKTTLMSLHDLVQSNPQDPQMAAKFDAAMQAVDNAIAVLPETQRQSPEFVLSVVDGLLETAEAEYTAAIADGKIVEVIEYQDSRGFVMYADSLYKNVASTMAQQNPQVHQQIDSSINELKAAWPSAIAPETPVKTPEQVSQLVDTIEQNTQKVVQ